MRCDIFHWKKSKYSFFSCKVWKATLPGISLRYVCGELRLICLGSPPNSGVYGNIFLYIFINRKIHSGMKTYSCELCGKSFLDSLRLRMHLLSHSGNQIIFKYTKTKLHPQKVVCRWVAFIVLSQMSLMFIWPDSLLIPLNLKFSKTNKK